LGWYLEVFTSKLVQGWSGTVLCEIPESRREWFGVYREEIGVLTGRISFDGCSENIPRILGLRVSLAVYLMPHIVLVKYDKVGI